MSQSFCRRASSAQWTAERKQSTSGRRRNIAIEVLEVRRLLSGAPVSFVVTDTSDSASDTGSLRHALGQANAAAGPSTITFAASAFPAGALTSIVLTGTPLELNNTTSSISIFGPGSGQVAIVGGANIANGAATGGSTIFMVAPATTAEIEGVTLNAGNSAGNPAAFSSLDGDGGAVYNDGTLVLAGDTISNSYANHGGGIFNGGVLTLDASTLTANHGTTGAGALDTSGAISSATVVGDNFTNNSSSMGAGAIESAQSTLIANNDTFTANIGASGGAIEAQGGSLTLMNSTLTNNTAGGSFGSVFNGGGVFDDQAISCTLTNDTLIGNGAAVGGGVYVAGNAVITGCTLANNTASDSAGGINDAPGSNLTLINSTLTGNTALEFGGGLLLAGSAAIIDSTIYANFCPTGAGVYNLGSSSVINNTIIAGNADSATDNTPDDWSGSGALGSSHDLIGAGGTFGVTDGTNGDLIGTNAVPINPLLSPLANNGGPTDTLAVMANSPVLGAGVTSNDQNGNPITVDQRGAVTVGGVEPSIGAYQLNAMLPSVANQLVFVQEPTNVAAGSAISPPVTVQVENSSGTVVAADDSNVTLALAGGTLGGTTTAAAINGVATFTDLTVGATGTYTLTAMDGSYGGATSGSFAVTAAANTGGGGGGGGGGGSGGGGGGGTSGGTLTPVIAKNTIPSSVVGGQPVGGMVTVALTNTAATIANGTATVKLFASTDGVIDTSSVLVASTARHVKIGAGKPFAVRLNVKTLPASLANGTYTLLAEAIDTSGNIADAASGPSVVLAAPFASLTSTISAVKPASIKAGKSGAFVVTITDTGNIASNGVAAFKIGLSTDGSTEAVSLESPSKALKIKSHKSVALHLHIVIGSSQPAGMYLPFVSVSEDGSMVSGVGPAFAIVAG